MGIPKKRAFALINERYKHPKTNLLAFEFEPNPDPSIGAKLANASIQRISIEGKEIYEIDRFFSEEEGRAMREYSRKATFSRPSYGSAEAIERGEKPARSMDSKERWAFFANSPPPIQEIYKLFGWLSSQLNAQITTLPWDLCEADHSSPAVIANWLEEASLESMEWGKHRDSDPQKGLSFGIPVLYEQSAPFHPTQFANGDAARPWLISAMLYVTDEAFQPEDRLGTAFYRDDGKLAYKVDCRHMRIALFESDLLHSIEASDIRAERKTWRVSYVFKLIANPREQGQSVKREFVSKLLPGLPGYTSSFSHNCS